MPIASVVADAHVLLSAVAGKAALRIFTEFGLTIHVAEFSADEVVEYLPSMAQKYAIPGELIKMQWWLLAVQQHPAHVYRRAFLQAAADLAQRDLKDAHALALARTLKLPLWSTDRDLHGFDVMYYPTRAWASAVVSVRGVRVLAVRRCSLILEMPASRGLQSGE
jgi:predicted nucleic acid-binding protein